MNKHGTLRPFSDRQLIVLLIPLLIEQLLNMTVGLADSLMVSYLGEVPVSAVSLVDTVNVLLVYLFSSLASGGAIVTGQYLGRKAMDQAQRSAEQLLIFVVSVEIPHSLTDAQKERVKAFASVCKESNYGKKSGFFKRIFEKFNKK